MIEQFILGVGTIMLAELGDKSHLLMVLLGSKYRDHVKLFIGIMLAFIVTNLIAVLLGKYFAPYLQTPLIRWVSAIAFVLFGIYTLFSHETGPIKVASYSPLVSAFLMILVAELGDKTQVVAALLAVKVETILLLTGLLVGLGIITYATIFLSKKWTAKLNEKMLHTVSGCIFMLLGVLTLFNLY